MSGRAPGYFAGSAGLELTLLVHPRLGSTNDEARRLAEAGAPAGTAVVALAQDGGRGRRGRVWHSPPGNLHFSLILRPARPMVEAAQLSFVAALALAEVVGPWLPEPAACRLKWPNDVLVYGRKVAGILVEAEGTADGRLAAWVVLGIGVNLRHCPDDTPYPATSLLAEAGQAPEPEVMARALGAALLAGQGRWLAQGFAPIRTAWLERAHGLGQGVTVQLAAETVPGRFEDLDPEGALVLSPADGGPPRRILAGDVFFPGFGAAP